MNLQQIIAATPKLGRGAHAENSGIKCLNEMVAFLAGEPHTDYPHCADSALSSWGMTINDFIGEERRQWIAELAPVLVGTYDPEHEQKRVEHLALQTTKRILPLALDPVGLTDIANRCRDAVTIENAVSAADAAYTAAAYIAADVYIAAAYTADAAYTAAAYTAADAYIAAAYAAADVYAADVAAHAAYAACGAANAAAADDAAADNVWRETITIFKEAIFLGAHSGQLSADRVKQLVEVDA